MKSLLTSISASVLILFIAISCDNSTANSTNHQTPEVRTLKESPKVTQASNQIVFNFENYKKDALPSNWIQSYIGKGDTEWKVIDDQGNKVMAQLYSDNPGHHYNAVVNDSINLKNMTLSVRLKGVSGRHDQGGGFIWRYQDKNNYYVVRANPLEDNVVLYKVKDGVRTDLPLMGKGRTYGVDVPKLGNDWNNMKLIVKDDIFTVFLNGNELFKVQDTTFPNAGKVGFWTKADAVTYFDDFVIRFL
ncbi:MAG: hypothetical protein DSY76_08025 [Bacteroidetes bacterium]|nr:MAG: hypothetical protein DSY76_08025 [Bacteroidota bacterium]